MKKSLLLSCVLAALALTACGGGGGGTPKSNSQQSTSSKNTKGPFTVSFDVNGGAETIPSQTIKKNDLVTEPATPTRNDPTKGAYTFLGWYNGDAAWSFTLDTVTSDMTLTAKWQDKYTVTFEGVSDAAIATQYVNRGDAIASKPADPTAPSGKHFYGWRNKKNGGQIWNFEDTQLKKVMEDLEFEPYFVDDQFYSENAFQPQVLEAELCPNILEMEGATYSGGSQGRGMTARDSHDPVKNPNPIGASGNYVWDTEGKNKIARWATEEDNPTDTFAGFVHNMHIEGNFLLWEFTSSAAASNVALILRACAEYGTEGQDGELVCGINPNKYKIELNGQSIDYGKIDIHNVIYNKFFTMQDYVISTNVSLKAGKNTLKVTVSNNDFVGSGSSLVAQAPVLDCFKLFSTSTIEWDDEELSVMDS